MKLRILLAAALALPVLAACDKPAQTPSASAPADERQANAPQTPDRMLQSAPPAGGIPPAGGTMGGQSAGGSATGSGNTGGSTTSPGSTPPADSGPGGSGGR